VVEGRVPPAERVAGGRFEVAFANGFLLHAAEVTAPAPIDQIVCGDRPKSAALCARAVLQWSSVRGIDSSAGSPVSGSIQPEMPISSSASASVSPGSYADSSADRMSAAASASVGKGPYSAPSPSARQ